VSKALLDQRDDHTVQALLAVVVARFESFTFRHALTSKAEPMTTILAEPADHQYALAPFAHSRQ
jgi:hypothetical protein